MPHTPRFVDEDAFKFLQAPAFLRWLIILMIAQLVVEVVDLAELALYTSGARFQAHLLTWIIGFIFRLYIIKALVNKWLGVRVLTFWWNAAVLVWLSREIFHLPRNYYNLLANSANYFHALFTLAVASLAIYVMVRPDTGKYLNDQRE